MPIKFRNRYLICTLSIKDPSVSLLSSITKQILLSTITSRLEDLCGDTRVGIARAGLSIKDMQVARDGRRPLADTHTSPGNTLASSDRKNPCIVFLLRTRRDCLREVWLAMTCVTEVERRVARILVEDVSGGLERVKKRYIDAVCWRKAEERIVQGDRGVMKQNMRGEMQEDAEGEEDAFRKRVMMLDM
jgi:RNase P/RNase MRP subunit POP5